MKKILTLCICIVFLVGCTSNKKVEKEKESEKRTINFVMETETEEESAEYERIGAFNQVVDEENIFELNDSINFDGIIYSNISVEYSKELPKNVSKDEVTYFEEKANDKGKLIDDNYYIICKITIENNTKKAYEVDLSGGKFAVLDENNAVYDSSQELRYRSGYLQTESDKNYYFSTLGSNEKKEFLLCYIVNESILKSDNLYYVLNPNGEAAGIAKLMAYRVK